MTWVTWFILNAGIASVLCSIIYWMLVIRRSPVQNVEAKETAEKMLDISGAIREGANAFLWRETRYIFGFMLVFSVLLVVLVDAPSALSFVVGASISILAGYLGMLMAVRGNVRTAAAAQRSIASAFRMAFRSGAVIGFALVGLAILGLLAMYGVMDWILGDSGALHVMEALAGFGLGGSSVALFARVGGGIYTKAADIGADLVGKVEENIPEDDPRNPAVIADNVGDNVGDIAGMGADLFGSIAESTCAALVIGAVAFAAFGSEALLYPLLITAVGVPASLLALPFARAGTRRGVEQALKRTLVLATIFMAIGVYFVTMIALPETFELQGVERTRMAVFYAVLVGLFAGMLIGIVTEYYTSHRFNPVRRVARASETGPATNVINGFALGCSSTMLPVIFIAITVFVGYHFVGMYGIAVSALGMLGTLAIALTIDSFGPVADNAGGIAEMAGLGERVRTRTDALDAAGNTTAAMGKGYAIGSATLTALALFAAFLVRSEIESLNLLKPVVITFLLVGAMLPFVFTAMTLRSVGRAAMQMIREVRRQFRSIPGLRPSFQITPQSLKALEQAQVPAVMVSALSGLVGEVFASEDALLERAKAQGERLGQGRLDVEQLRFAINRDLPTPRPNYRACVDISTRASLREMILPGAQVILTPLVVGFLFGVEALAAMLIGSLAAGMVLAIASSNAGGAWDNAKKYIESGRLGGKGSDVHSAAVVGDTVGDPFKDTSGPALNILIKLQAIISLVFAPFFTHSLNLFG